MLYSLIILCQIHLAGPVPPLLTIVIDVDPQSPPRVACEFAFDLVQGPTIVSCVGVR